jgi:hypothetical protein
VSPFAREKGTLVPISEAPEERATSDALMLREPLVTLLSAADQARVVARFGYDYRKQSGFVAGFILFFSSLGIVTSTHSGARISFLVASGLAVEQIYRLAVFRKRPVGSVLGVVARLFVGKLL